MAERHDTITDFSDVAHAVRERRRELRLRFEDVATMSGTTRQLVSAIERGEANDQVEKLLRILDVLQIKLDLRRGQPRHVDAPAAKPRPARTRGTPSVAIADMHREPGRVICLDCGSAVRSIATHVRQQHGLSMASYRQRWSIGDEFDLKPRDEGEIR